MKKCTFSFASWTVPFGLLCWWGVIAVMVGYAASASAEEESIYRFSPPIPLVESAYASNLDPYNLSVDADGMQKVRVVFDEISPSARRDKARIFMSETGDGGATWGTPKIISPDSESSYNYMPDIATDGHGAWISMWCNQNQVSNLLTEPSTLYFTKFADDGTTVIPPTRVPAVPGVSVRKDRNVSLGTFGNGVWIATYYMQTAHDQLNRTFSLAIAKSLDNGESWESYLHTSLAGIYYENHYFGPPATDIHFDPVSNTAKLAFKVTDSSEYQIWVATLNGKGDVITAERIKTDHLEAQSQWHIDSLSLGYLRETNTWMLAWVNRWQGTHFTYSRAVDNERFEPAQVLESPYLQGAEYVKVVKNHESENWTIFASGHNTVGAISNDNGLNWVVDGKIQTQWPNFYSTTLRLNAISTGFNRIVIMWTYYFGSPYSAYSPYDPGAELPIGIDNDLVVNGENISDVAREDAPFTVSYTILNNADDPTTVVLTRIKPIDGLTLAGVKFKGGDPVRWRTSTDSLWATYEGIPPGQTRRIDVQYIASEAGTYFVNGSATAEAGDVVPEDNLHRFVQVEVEPSNQDRGKWLRVSTRSFRQGWSKIQAAFAMRNTSNAAETPAYVVIYQSEDAVWDESDVPVKVTARPSLAPGQFFITKFSKWYRTLPTGHYYIAVINAFGDAPEPFPVRIP